MSAFRLTREQNVAVRWGQREQTYSAIFVLHGVTYAQKQAVKSCGFRFDFDRRRWWTHHESDAILIAPRLDEASRALVEDGLKIGGI